MNNPLGRGETAAENRRFPRIPLKMNLNYQVVEEGGSPWPLCSQTLAEDLGARGLAMQSRHALEAGQMLELTLLIPPHEKRLDLSDASIFPEEQCLKVNVLARVAWCRKEAPDRFLLGVEFIYLEPHDSEQLKLFLVDYQLDDPNSPRRR